MLNRSGNTGIWHAGGTEEKVTSDPWSIAMHCVTVVVGLPTFCATCMSVHGYNQSVSLVDPLLIL